MDVANKGGLWFLNKNGGLISALKSLYPDSNWTSYQLYHGENRLRTSKGQMALLDHLKPLFNKYEIYVNRRVPNVITDEHLQYDVSMLIL
jgi:hypothetical protein